MQNLQVRNLPELERYIRCDHVEIFWDSATKYRTFILVRRLNPKSMYYIGLSDYTPKNVDCKAKTAPADYTHPQYGKKETAGLVVDPTVDGIKQMFGGKYGDAKKWWDKTLKFVADDERYISKHKPFVVQTNVMHKHFGCLMYAEGGNRNACNYIHGDYDLYGLIKEVKPRPNDPKSTTTLHGTTNKFGPVYKFLSVHLNQRFGTPMIQHGSQDTFKGFTNEKIDIFLPNGEIKVGVGEAETRIFYATWLNGRVPYGDPV